MSTVPHNRRSRRVRIATVTATLLAAFASTSASASTDSATTEPPEADLDMAGNEVETPSVEPLVLTATYDVGLERPRGQVLQRFIEEVNETSGGAITIDATVENPDSIQQWSDGDFDIILVPARTLDTVGVTTFDALSLPFVVQDDDQADRVATSPAADAMMAGLSAIDATGLVLAPITQEHLAIHSDEPLRTLDQLHTGVRMHPHSNTLDKLYEALGAHSAYDLSGASWDAAVTSGEALALEYPTALANGGGGPSQMATNFTWFYDFGVVMIRNDSLAELTPEQAEILKGAADATLQRQIDERIREEDAFAQACSDGATLTAAPYSFMGEVGFAVHDVILEMLEDPAARELYDAVRLAAGKNKVPEQIECTWSDVHDYVPPDPPSTTFPEGVYRSTGSTPDQMYVRGVPRGDNVNNSVDYFEWVIEGGTITLTFYRDDAGQPEVVAPYTIDELGRIVVDGWTTFTWQESADGVTLEEVPTDDPQARWDQWEIAMYGLTHLVKVS